jgi:hypothetical protein
VFPRRTDANQPEIVKAFRDLGCSVRSIHMVGSGVPDLLVGVQDGRAGVTLLVEIKDGAKPPSARRLTRAEQLFADNWLGRKPIVVSTVEEAAQAVAQARRGWTFC